MSRRKAFTLIELLVVIAIIALLLSILMPSLQTVKKTAQGVVCMSNTKGLSMGWVLYTGDSDGRVPDSYPGDPTPASENWVQKPQDLNGIVINPMANATLDDRVRGIKAGSIFPYIEEHKLYHCRGDKRFSRGYNNYLSYAMPMVLRDRADITNRSYTRKVAQLSMPQEKYIFVEESDTRPYQVGAWGLGTKEFDNRYGWWDGLAVWHNNSSTFGFADGHAEKQKWKNEETLERANRMVSEGGGYGYQPYTSGPREDLDWLQAHWPYSK